VPKDLDRIVTLDELGPGERGEPFLPVRTLKLVNHYADGTSSREYLCDVVVPRWVDAVAVVLYHRDGDRVRVGLKECLRPCIYVRRTLDLPFPDRERSPIVLELVAGRLEPDDTGWEGVVRRTVEEAMEEAGFAVDPSAVRRLGPPYFSTPGMSPEKIYMTSVEVDPARAREVEGDGSPMEDVGRVRFVELRDALGMCRSGEIEDAKTEIGLLRLKEQLGV
jgi:ADP-ribose pyrophosphatase